MTEPHRRLDQFMHQRRLELRMSWAQVAAAAGISEAWLRAIRRGLYDMSDMTAVGLEDALGWKRGSIGQILDGGEPALEQTDDVADRIAELEAQLRELRRRAR